MKHIADLGDKIMDTKDLLESHLSKINWSLRDFGCSHWSICDHNEIITKYILFGNSITNKNGNTVSEFEVTPETIRMVDDSGVAIGSDTSFVLFMNHD